MTKAELLLHWGKVFKIEDFASLSLVVEDQFFQVDRALRSGKYDISVENGNIAATLARFIDSSMLSFDTDYYKLQLLRNLLYYRILPTAAEKEGVVSIIANDKHFDTRRRTEMKVGKFVKLLVPTITDVELEKVVNEYKSHFRDYEYEYVEGTSEHHFYEAYTAGHLPTIDCGNLEAFLCDSCMQHDHWPIHPATAYATGDFTICSLWHGDQIAARTIISNKKKIRTPIYTTSLKAHQKLASILDERGYKYSYDGWEGHTLQLLVEHGTVYAPYLDFAPCKVMVENGKMVLKLHRDCSYPNYVLNDSHGEHELHNSYEEEEEECF